MNTVIQQSRPTVSIDQARPQAIVARMPNIPGSRGISIQSTIVDGTGHLIITLSNGVQIDAGYVKGADGVGIAGVSVSNVAIDQNGHLIVALSNATQIDAGTLVDQAATAAIQEHISANGNPHGTTAADVGAYTIAEADNAISQAINTNRIHLPVVILGAHATDIEAIQAAYPNPLEGWFTSVDVSNNSYRYDAVTATWIWTDAASIPMAGPTTDGKMSAADYSKLAQQSGMNTGDQDLSGLIPKSLATAASQFLVSSGVGEFAVKTVEEVKLLLGQDKTTEIPYSKSGDIATSIGTLARIVKRAGTISSIYVSLGVIGTSDTIVKVMNNGVEVATLTFNSTSPTAMEITGSTTLAVNDKLTVNVTESSGTKAKDLSITILEKLT